MKKFLCLAILSVVFALTGCTPEEQKFAAAMQKLNDASYMESESTITYEMDYTGTDEYLKQQMRVMENLFNAQTMKLTSEYEKNAKSGAARVHANLDWALDPVTANMDMWIDLDLADGVYDITFKVPALAKAFLPEEYAKDYAVIDYFALIDSLTGTNMNSGAVSDAMLEQLTAISEEAHGDLPGMMEKFGLTAALEGNVTVKSRTESGGNEILTLTMNDEQLKAFVIAYLEEIKTNEELLALMIEISTGSFGAAGIEVTPELLESITVGVGPGFDAAITQVEEFFDKTTVLGDEGIVYEIVLDANGSMTSDSIVADFLIDADALDANTDGQIRYTVKVDDTYKNVNADKRVIMPVQSAANTVNVSDAITAQQELAAAEMKWQFPMGYAYYLENEMTAHLAAMDEPVNFYLKGEFDGTEYDDSVSLAADEQGGIYFSLDQAMEILGGTVTADEEQGVVYWETESGIFVITTGDENDTEFYESFPEDYFMDNFLSTGIYFGESLYIDMWSLELVGIDFGFDEETNTILIRDGVVY